MPADQSQAPLADLINAVSVANKISHAHLHAYELHLSAADIDPHATVSGSRVPAQQSKPRFAHRAVCCMSHIASCS